MIGENDFMIVAQNKSAKILLLYKGELLWKNYTIDFLLMTWRLHALALTSKTSSFPKQNIIEYITYQHDHFQVFDPNTIRKLQTTCINCCVKACGPIQGRHLKNFYVAKKLVQINYGHVPTTKIFYENNNNDKSPIT